jgi:hypothetical protein
MNGSKIAILVCAFFTLAMAAPTGGNLLDLGDILKPVTGIVGNLGDDLGKLLKDVTGLVAKLLKDLLKIVEQLIKVLGIPDGVDPLSFVQNLVSQLEPIVDHLLEDVSSGAGEIIEDVSCLRGFVAEF